MKNFNYFTYDMGQLTNRKINKYFYAFIFLLILLDTFYTYWLNLQFKIEESVNWYVFLENSLSLIRGFYFVILPILAVFPFSLQYYYEKKSNYRNYLISRGSRRSYFLSKCLMNFLVGFLTIFTFLIVNYIIVHLLYPNFFALGGTFVEPDSGAFLESIFYDHINLYQFLYIVINSLFGGIIAVFSLSLSMVINYKSEFLVIGIPFIIYSIQSVILYFIYPQIDIMGVIQPATRFGFVNPITIEHVIICFSIWIFLSLVLFVIGYKKERDLL